MAETSYTSEIRDEDLNRVLTEINVSQEDVNHYFTAVSYEGADPRIIFNKVMDLINSDDRVWTAVKMVIAFGLYRGFGSGKPYSKLMETTRKTHLTAVKNAFGTLGIVIGAPQRKTDVTIGRLMAAFPDLTHKIWCRKMVPRLSTNGFNLPNQYAYPGAPAAMTAEDWTQYRDEWARWAVELSKKWKKEKTKEEILKFAEIQHATELYPMEYRRNRGF
jgi:hypothetical protein